MDLSETQKAFLQDVWSDETKRDAFKKGVLLGIAESRAELSVTHALDIFEALGSILSKEEVKGKRLNQNV